MSRRQSATTLVTRARGLAFGRLLSLVDPELARLSGLRGALRDVVPPEALTLDPHAYVPTVEHEAPGIDFREAEQLALLERWGGDLQSLFAALRADPGLNLGPTHGDRLFNAQYHTPDAEIYAALIADRRPGTILEIGAGYSTRIARRTISTLELESTISVIDPEPRAAIDTVVDRFVPKRVEDAAAELLQLGASDILFVDSSHVARSGSDVPLLFGEVIPRLPPGVLVHVHDVFLPWDYPEAYRRRLYTEQYVLQALLAHAPRYRVVFATQLMSRRHPEAMRAAFGRAVASGPDFYGASFWFEVVSPPAA